MLNHITNFFKFLFPILRSAIVQVAADELTRIAYPKRPFSRRPPHTSYTRYSPSRAMREPFERETVEPGNNGISHKYHDVVMIAFDVEGSNIEDVHNWLMDQMPEPGTHGDAGEINFDSWWVANDDRFDGSDCDSAVFVAPGKQKEARKVLWQAGLSSEYGQRS